MKIGILIDRLNVGGVEKIAIEQVKALKNIGQDATLVILSKKAVVEDAFSDLLQGIPIVYLDDRIPSMLRISFRFPIFYFFSFFHIWYPFILPFFIKKREFDHVISHGTYTCFTAITIGKFCGIPVSSFIWDPIGYILEKVYISKFNKVIFGILLNIARFLDRLIVDNSKYVFVGGSAHNEYLQSLNFSKRIVLSPPSTHIHIPIDGRKSTYCLLVTAWKEGKGPEYIIEILKNTPSLHIKMAGKWIDPVYQASFVLLLEKYGFSNRVDVLGSVSEQELITLYQNALFLFQINDDRGFGMPALEAAGCGTTFIIPRNQGVCALFEDGVDGFYTDEKDTTQITKKISLLIQNQNVAQEMGKKAFAKVKEKYSWEKHAQNLLSVIGEPS